MPAGVVNIHRHLPWVFTQRLQSQTFPSIGVSPGVVLGPLGPKPSAELVLKTDAEAAPGLRFAVLLGLLLPHLVYRRYPFSLTCSMWLDLSRGVGTGKTNKPLIRPWLPAVVHDTCYYLLIKSFA